MKSIGSNPTISGPMERAIKSVKEAPSWTLRNPPKDVRRLVERAIKEQGGDKNFWILECLRSGLKRYATGKKDSAQ